MTSSPLGERPADPIGFQANLDDEASVAYVYPTREWAQGNFPGREIREVRANAITTVHKAYRDAVCILCGRTIGAAGGRGGHVGRRSHFRKHIRDGSLYEFNRPAATLAGAADAER